MADLSVRGPLGLNGLTLREAAAALEARRITSEDLVGDCLDRIAAREGTVRAWDYLDADHALAQARQLDRMPRRSALHGVPVGIKDIFDTRDMPTAHGFPPYKGKRWRGDSACVAALRDAGMVIFGKTLTTQFASSVPRDTRNPHDPRRTPGVSSSGSAAAVADFMVPLANGSQTGGSVIGPSANCGVYGFKASLDGIDRTGFRHCKPSIDTIGLFTRTVDDLILARGVQTGAAPAPALGRGDAPRIGVVRTEYWRQAEPCMRAAVDRATKLLAGAGAQVRAVRLPRLFSDIVPEFTVANGWESSRVLAREIRENLDSFNPHNRARVEEVRGLTEADYRRACRRINAARRAMADQFRDFDAFISPSLQGESPIGVRQTRSGVFARLWTQMHTPAVNLPLFSGPNGLPVCFQVVGPKGADGRTLAVAAWIDGRLRAALGRIPTAA